MSIPWAMQMKAVSIEEPARLVQTLTGAILGCGGWVLSRGANDTGTINMLFEFERQACVDIYSVLIAAGLELSQSGHIRFTELCQCTRSNQQDCGTEIASIDLEIQTFPVEAGDTRCRLSQSVYMGHGRVAIAGAGIRQERISQERSS